MHVYKSDKLKYYKKKPSSSNLKTVGTFFFSVGTTKEDRKLVTNCTDNTIFRDILITFAF